MEAARVLRDLIGDLVVLDVGGATTDVHSVTDGSVEIRRVQIHPEPAAKRTVEGDLGVYVNAANIVRLAGEDVVAAYRAEMSPPAPGAEDPMRAAPGAEEPVLAAPGAEEPVLAAPGAEEPVLAAHVEALARIAAEIALVRHAGRLRYLFGPTGRVTVAEGKDLTEVEWLVGTGGPLVRFPHGRETLERLAGMTPAAVETVRRRGESPAGGYGPAGPAVAHLLPGRGARPLLDKRYIIAALGVLHQEYPEAAATLLRESFVPENAGGGKP
jgi:hypothetical protein